MNSQKVNGKTIITCKHCGNEFSCGTDEKGLHCWCYNLPNIMLLTPEAQNSEDCYCPKCLEEIISDKLKTLRKV